MDRFRDRRQAGERLADRLVALGYGRVPQVLVFALPRGGVPVAHPIAQRLGAPLDVWVVRKLGVPGHEELALGAIAAGGGRVVNEEVVRELRITPEAIAQVEARETQELLRRERLYRGGRPLPELAGKTVLLVDDGLATGATMKAAIAAARARGPAQLVVAVPVAPPDILREVEALADAVVCLKTPAEFRAVGLWYEHFPQVSDEEVLGLLQRPPSS
ncbi:MAG: phosphoribosyltransferase [Meiothermus sp.]|uniref:phosphoribosyltransferase n=1 Tax=Meiothermus sp. TaxID=1955249 RepID=UPI0025ED1F94|nr:phosphoribosyltransferase [Meiothermus sp.]MCS7058286.1 phosphoribosyltransferase [Meiothermus sp.]MCS7193582.1 phosphoribosyltransferase [Meiothermus sp.]MCX7739828.1 phosphoribosyltransferase [Meiothermus sp.]MDW8090595.1 phosphoribosyltransferase [Meiothermus sp.]MDW8480511.1 phosphoribosyltransferase [Meiothermus sp.]